MKSLILPSLVLAVFSVPTFAVDSQWFVGGGLGYQNDKVEYTGDKTDGDDIVYQLKGGVILNQHHRLTFEYNYSDNTIFSDSYIEDGLYSNQKDKLKQNLFLLSYDYLIPLNEKFNVFAGLTAGVSNSKNYYTWSGVENGNYNLSSTDFVWGAQVGAEYNINKNWTTSLAYRYLMTDDVKYYDGMTNGLDISTQQVMLGVAYNF